MLYLDIWSMLLLTSASLQAIQVTSLEDGQRRANSNIVLEENNLPPIIYCLFSYTDFNAISQDLGKMLHLSVA